MEAPRHAQGARQGFSQGNLEGHKPSNPGDLLGHEDKDMGAVTGRMKGSQAAPGPSTPSDPLAVIKAK